MKQTLNCSNWVINPSVNGQIFARGLSQDCYGALMVMMGVGAIDDLDVFC